MKPTTLLLVLISVAAAAGAQVLLKIGVRAPEVRQALDAAGPLSLRAVLALVHAPAILGGLLIYALSVLLWLGALARLDLSVAYPFVGLGIVLTTFAGMVLLGEPLTLMRVAASLLIVGGIVLMALSI